MLLLFDVSHTIMSYFLRFRININTLCFLKNIMNCLLVAEEVVIKLTKQYVDRFHSKFHFPDNMNKYELFFLKSYLNTIKIIS